MQIKRPEPHPPEHEHNDATSPGTSPLPSNPDLLVSEPANCPYCQQPEFGVTYDPPPFRRGLVYVNMTTNNLGNVSSAMSSSSSLNSVASPGLAPVTMSRRRTASISANAPTVITTDKIRPDWATKLTNARSHAARRAAAATALHTAAYLMGNDSRGFAFTSRGRFGRRGGESPGSDAATPPTGGPNSSPSPFSVILERNDTGSHGGSNQVGGSSRRRSRMDDLEDMMMLEAIRLSLAAEEERKKKEEKEAKKEAKKKEKAEKKAEKSAEKAAKKMYNAGGNSPASASGSTLSLSLPGIGRRRGNSGGPAFLREAAASTDKGKSVDRSILTGTTEASGFLPTLEPGRSPVSTLLSSRYHLDTAGFGTPLTEAQSSPIATAPEKPSHLRQMSNASSPASSFVESAAGSLRNDFRGSSSSLDSPNASGTHLVGGTPDRDIDAGGQAMDSMFNFRSLAEMMGLEEEKGNKSNHIQLPRSDKTNHGPRQGEGSTNACGSPEETMDQSTATLKADLPCDVDGIKGGFADTYIAKMPTPEVMITPVTPASPGSRDESNNKQLAQGMIFGTNHTGNVTH